MRLSKAKFQREESPPTWLQRPRGIVLHNLGKPSSLWGECEKLPASWWVGRQMIRLLRLSSGFGHLVLRALSWAEMWSRACLCAWPIDGASSRRLRTSESTAGSSGAGWWHCASLAPAGSCPTGHEGGEAEWSDDTG